MNRRKNNRNFSYNDANRRDFNNWGEVNSFQSLDGANLVNILSCFKDEILQRLDNNDKQLRKLITDSKHEILRKFTSSGKQMKFSHKKLKNDICNKICGFKSQPENSESSINSGMVENQVPNYFQFTDDFFSLPGQETKSKGSRKLYDHDDFNFLVNNNNSPIGLNNEDDVSDLIIETSNLKLNLDERPVTTLTNVMDRIDIVHKQMNDIVKILGTFIPKDELNNDLLEEAAISTNNNRVIKDIHEFDPIYTIKSSNEIVKQDCRKYNDDGGKTGAISLRYNDDGRRTGAIKKVYGLAKGITKPLEILSPMTEVKDDEEMLEIVKKLSNTLDIYYDRENTNVVCRQNSIVIKFRNDNEFDKWRAAARKIIEKDKFSYDELLALEDQNALFTTEKIECPICLMDCEAGNGVILRDCVHAFCRQCLISTVQHSTDSEILCPYSDGDYMCPSAIQQREIKEIVPEHLFEQYLSRSVTVVGNRSGNYIHCRTPDCNNFYFIDNDELTSFHCGKCSMINCIPCKAVHFDQTCKEYQDELKILSETDPKARETLRAFKAMVDNREAMHCPGCNIIVIKSEGCDWIQCVMCRTEICWATMGPRWGPGGRGDVTGGCKCQANGVRCHPKCNFCH